jgi:transposase-like protein
MTFIDAHCPSCGRTFRESANRLCEGQILSCPHCQMSWPLNPNSPFDEVVRLLREARQSRFDRLTAQPYRWSA